MKDAIYVAKVRLALYLISRISKFDREGKAEWDRGK